MKRVKIFAFLAGYIAHSFLLTPPICICCVYNTENVEIVTRLRSVNSVYEKTRRS